MALRVNVENFDDATVTGSITAINGEVALNIAGYRGVSYVLTGTWTATIQAQISVDDGANWVAVDSYRFSNEQVLLNNTVNDTYAVSDLQGANRIKIIATAFTSGTINVRIRATQTDTIQNTKYDGVGVSAVPKHAVYIGGQAKVSTLPTAATDATLAPITTDKFGRNVSYPYTIRDLTATAAATLTRSLETTVLAGVAATFMDVLKVTGVNTSTNAVSVSIRSGTGGAVLDTISIPAAGAAGASAVTVVNYQFPLPMSEAAQSWTGQITNTGEISDSPVTINMIAIQNQ